MVLVRHEYGQPESDRYLTYACAVAAGGPNDDNPSVASANAQRRERLLERDMDMAVTEDRPRR
jgi:hypothetical protein